MTSDLHKTKEKFENIKAYQVMLDDLVNSRPINNIKNHGCLKKA